MKLAAAQTIPQDGNIEANISDHCRLAELAADNGVQLIIFPEMSLTGYQRAAAQDLAFAENDVRLQPLKEIAAIRNITIVAGAPIAIHSHLYIGSFIISPDETSVYTKQFLHEGEEAFFVPGFSLDPKPTLGSEKISFAICADIANPQHPANAAKDDSTLYLPGIFYTPAGIIEGHERLGEYAKKYAMNILMSNYGGASWGLDGGGKSAFWNNKGELIGCLGNKGEGLLLATRENESWHCFSIPTRK